jgi:hypothetical protein
VSCTPRGWVADLCSIGIACSSLRVMLVIPVLNRRHRNVDRASSSCLVSSGSSSGDRLGGQDRRQPRFYSAYVLLILHLFDFDELR